jgi:cyclic dehypoxanthinyl futalosine synthase
MGSLMLEENVVSQAGTVHHLTLDEITRAIREIGYEPRQRDVFYRLVEPSHTPATTNGLRNPLAVL